MDSAATLMARADDLFPEFDMTQTEREPHGSPAISKCF